MSRKNQLTYYNAEKIVEQYQDAPKSRLDQIKLLQLAGYSTLQGKLFTTIPDAKLFRAAQNTRKRARKFIAEFVFNDAADHYFQRLYDLFEFDPKSEEAPDPEELERRLLD